eukprot:256440-Prorocentrum_minimum.AAC.1
MLAIPSDRAREPLEYHIPAREGDNVTAMVEEFVDVWGISEDYSAKLLAALSERVNKRSARPVLLQLPVSASDGRSLVLKIRQGEQHDPSPFVREFLEVAKQVNSHTAAASSHGVGVNSRCSHSTARGPLGSSLAGFP